MFDPSGDGTRGGCHCSCGSARQTPSALTREPFLFGARARGLSVFAFRLYSGTSCARKSSRRAGGSPGKTRGFLGDYSGTARGRKMPADQTLSFGPYRLDLNGARLWRGKQAVRLTGKAWAVLHHLVTHAGTLVTKEELFQAVWPGTVVSDDALTSCIQGITAGVAGPGPRATLH